jgi:TAP-like protein
MRGVMGERRGDETTTPERSCSTKTLDDAPGPDPFVEASRLASMAGGDPGFQDAYVESPYLDVCEVWDVEEATSVAHRPVSSDTPMLIYVGEYDAYGLLPVAEQASTSLSGSFLVDAPYQGHNVLGSLDCYQASATHGSRTPRRLRIPAASRRSRQRISQHAEELVAEESPDRPGLNPPLRVAVRGLRPSDTTPKQARSPF